MAVFVERVVKQAATKGIPARRARLAGWFILVSVLGSGLVITAIALGVLITSDPGRLIGVGILLLGLMVLAFPFLEGVLEPQTPRLVIMVSMTIAVSGVLLALGQGTAAVFVGDLAIAIGLLRLDRRFGSSVGK